LEPLDRQAGRVAIENPLDKFSKFFVHEGPPYSAEGELCEAVLEQVKIEELGLGLARDSLQKEPRKHQIDTVYLQLVMQRLWAEEVRQKSRVLRRRTLDALQAQRPIVMTYLNEVMDTLTTEEKEIASRVFRYLVTPSGSRVAYPVNELAESEKIDKEKLTNVLGQLSVGENRILRQVVTSPDPSVAPRYEIFHPALALAILEWRARFVSEQREVEIRLASRKLQQEIAGKLERKSKQVTRLFIALIVFGLLIISLIISGVYILRLKRMAQEAQRKAEEQTAEATRLKGDADEYIKLVKAQDLAIRDTRVVMRRHEAPVTSVAFSPDYSLIVTGSQDGTAIVWDTNGTLIQRLVGHSGAIHDVAFSPDGNYVATAGDDHTVRLWNRRTWESIVMWEHAGPVLSVVFAHAHNLLVSSSTDATSRIWVPGNTQSIFVLKGHTEPIHYCEFSPDDTLIVTASSDHTARVWSSESGEMKQVLNEHKGEVTRASFGLQGKQIVTASKDHTARVWDTASGKRLYVLNGHTDAVNDAEFSPDGKYIVTASADLTARIWNGNGVLYSLLNQHSGSVNTARFSADGERVVTASDDKTARTWNARSQSGPIALVELKGHLDKVTNAIFVSNDEIILTISADQTARLWDVTRFGGFRVEDVSIGQFNYQGPCPKTITVEAKVTFEGSGVLRYTWSPGPAGKSRQGALLATTSPTYIRYSFRLDGAPELPISGVIGLQMNQPNSASAKQPFKLRCTAQSTPTPTPTPSP
jgi:WD40 repeat protein